jgi:hypothetical protein
VFVADRGGRSFRDSSATGSALTNSTSRFDRRTFAQDAVWHHRTNSRRGRLCVPLRQVQAAACVSRVCQQQIDGIEYGQTALMHGSQRYCPAQRVL